MSDSGIPTGLPTLDDAFADSGLLKGSVVVIQMPPNSIGEMFLYNLAADVKTTFYTGAKSPDFVRSQVESISKMDSEDRLTVESMAVDETPKQARERIDERTISSGELIIIHPVDIIEEGSDTDYRNFLRAFATNIRESDAVGVLSSVNPSEQQPPTNRWLTQASADTVFNVLQQRSNESIAEYLAIEKLHPDQTLMTSETRVSELELGKDLDIDSEMRVG